MREDSQTKEITSPSDKLLPQILKDNPHAVKDYLRQRCSLQGIVQYNCNQMTRSEARAKEKAYAEAAASEAPAAKTAASKQRLDEPKVPKPRAGSHLERDEGVSVEGRVVVGRKGPERKETVCEDVLRLFRV